MKTTFILPLLAASFATSVSAQILVDGSFDDRGPSGEDLGPEVAETGATGHGGSGVYTSVANNSAIDGRLSELPGLVDQDQIYSEVANTSGSNVYGVFGGIGDATRGISFYVDGSTATGTYNLQFDLMTVDLGSGDFSNNTLRVDIIQWNDSGTGSQPQYRVLNDLTTDADYTDGIGNALVDVSVETLTLDSLIQSTNSDLATLAFSQINDSTNFSLSPSDNLAVRFIAGGVNLRSGGANREWVAIDNVALVPEPSSYALLAAFTALLALLRRRRR